MVPGRVGGGEIPSGFFGWVPKKFVVAPFDGGASLGVVSVTALGLGAVIGRGGCGGLSH